MRVGGIVLTAALALGLVACSSEDERKAGRTLYKANQETQKAAAKAGREIKKAGKEMRQGWNDAKRDAQAQPKK